MALKFLKITLNYRLIITAIIAIINTVEALIFYCDIDGSHVGCTTNGVSFPNEPIFLDGKPNDYENSEVLRMPINNFERNFTMTFLPRNLFKFFPNLEAFFTEGSMRSNSFF